MRDYGPTLTYEDGRILALDRVFKNQSSLDTYWDVLEQVANTELTWQQLKAPYGLHQSAWDALSIREQIKDEQYIPIMVPVLKKTNSNPFESAQIQKAIAEQRDRYKGGVIDREKFYAEAAAEWSQADDVKKAAKTSAAKREPVVSASRKLSDRIRFDPSATLDEVRLAVNSITQAETPGACLDTAKKMYVQVASAETARNKAKCIELQARMDDIKSLMGETDEPPHVEPPAPKPQTPEQKVEFLKIAGWGEAEQRIDHMREVSERPGAINNWRSLCASEVDAERRWEMHLENVNAPEAASE